MKSDIVKIVVGDEYDEALRKALSIAISEIGAEVVDKSGGVAGSQDLEVLVINVGGETIKIEAETFVGISVEGPELTVADFMKVVNKHL
ncbi:hypothetical protein SB768_19315 [Burkholderia sp. SIMBA_043]|uniref:hypothetical protein n=1 Tax=Burkholderia TaxID=32008 RepID=UPI000F803245|nr:hypothetical protein [Burkholderia vietnamiensis]MBR7910080.1 hypothetical protein [Burkholderia vietnamiensis]MBR8003818.1 hypothetical protein [Burkholderia vietnamiensis]MBR8087660.1 hypothetical protein [Burkholderia vietnamiensis]MBR8194142.1 hypothetical protein [Burkholderia vietnamiensis]MBR8228194.1 hypothetical protein [Burkholderia vietnamiensis]